MNMPGKGLSVIVCVVIVSYFTPFLFADQQVPKQVLDWQKAAQERLVQGDTAGAVENYQKIQQSFPDTAYATEAQRQIVQVYVQSGQKDQAKAALAELKQKYASRPEYVKQVHELGWEFVKAADYTTAIQIYTDLQKQFPNHERAAWFQRSIVQTYLEQGDIDKVKQAVEDLKNNYQSHPDYANQMMTTADRLRGKKQYTIAEGIYDHLLKQLPDNKQAVIWKRAQIRNALASGQTETAKVGVGDLFSTYSSNAEFVKQAHELGWEFVKAADYTTAIQIYTDLQKQFPNHERAVWFQRSIVQTYLEQGDTQKALQAVEQMKTNFQTHPDYANQMEKLADNLIDKNQPAAAKGVCETLIEKFPNHSRMPWFLHYKARSEVWMKNPKLADTTVTLMQQKYDAKDPNYADAMSWTAYNYRTAGFYQRAIELYEWLLKQNPGPKVQLRSIAGIAQAYVQLGDDAKVQEKVDYLLSHFKDNLSGVAFYMLGIGEEYYLAGQETGNDELFYKSIALLKDVPLATNQNKQFIPNAQYMLGLNYQYLGEYLKAASAFENVYAADPQFIYAEYCLFSAGHCYEKLLKQNLVSETEGKTFIRRIYTQFLQIYPDSQNAPHVREWLKNMPE